MSNLKAEDKRCGVMARASRAAILAAYDRLGTAKAVATEFGVTKETASRRLRREGVNLRHNRGRYPRVKSEFFVRIPDEMMLAAYERLGNAKAVAQEFGVNATMACRRLRALGVNLRRNSGRKGGLWDIPDEVVMNEFRRQGSASAMARFFGVTPAAGCRRMNALGVNLRPGRVAPKRTSRRRR